MKINLRLRSIVLVLILMVFILIVTGCNKEEEFPEYKIINGDYGGTYTYQDKGYGCAIFFEENTYREILLNPSIYSRKAWYCISAGSYHIDKDKLIFEIDSLVYDFDPAEYQCNPDCFLPGEYNVTYLNTASDTLYFERGEGEHKIEYQLWRFD